MITLPPEDQRGKVSVKGVFSPLSNKAKSGYDQVQTNIQNANKSKQAVKGAIPSLSNMAKSGYDQAIKSSNARIAEKEVVKNTLLKVASQPVKAALGVGTAKTALKGANAIVSALKSISSKAVKAKQKADSKKTKYSRGF